MLFFKSSHYELGDCTVAPKFFHGIHCECCRQSTVVQVNHFPHTTGEAPNCAQRAAVQRLGYSLLQGSKLVVALLADSVL